MSWEFFIACAIGLFIFLSLAIVWTAFSAPLLLGFALFLFPLMLMLLVIVAPLAIVAGWFYDEHEILGTEPDAIPG